MIIVNEKNSIAYFFNSDTVIPNSYAKKKF
jgi:hypothetical protein